MTEPGRRRHDTPGSSGVLVVGYGNTLRSDDGVGARAAEALAEDPRLAGANVLAVHQLAPELALEMSRASLVIFVDASAEEAPGAVAVRRLVDGPGRPATGTTSHHVGPQELVTVAAELYEATPEVVVVSVGVATMEVGEALSPDVAAALPAVSDAVVGLVAAHRG